MNEKNKDLGVVHHWTTERGDLTNLNKGVEKAKSAIDSQRGNHEEKLLQLKRDAALKIKEIQEQLVADEKAENDSFLGNAEELNADLRRARSYLEKGINDDLAAAERKALESAKELGYQTVKFDGQTDNSWSFVFSDRVVEQE